MAISENLEIKFKNDSLNKKETIKPGMERFIMAFREEVALLLKDSHPSDIKHPDLVAEIKNWTDKFTLKDMKNNLIEETKIKDSIFKAADDYSNSQTA